MLDKTIDNALLHLRKQIKRGDGKGLRHVEALLTMRGIPMPRVLPPKAPNTAPRGHMTYAVLNSLRECPMTIRELVAVLALMWPDVPRERLYWRTASRLNDLRVKGLVRREGRGWALAP